MGAHFKEIYKILFYLPPNGNDEVTIVHVNLVVAKEDEKATYDAKHKAEEDLIKNCSTSKMEENINFGKKSNKGKGRQESASGSKSHRPHRSIDQ